MYIEYGLVVDTTMRVVIINTDTNLDVFYINSNRPPTGKERLGDVDINLYYDN